MRCRLIAAFAALSLIGVVGCGGSETAAPVAAAPGTSGSAPNDPIARVVYDFFNAVRQGQTAAAHQYLTPLSLQRITALDMNIAPPGSATASFQVGQVTTRENDRALVSLTWTDLDADGKPYNEPILCELRQVDGHWRICGMAQDLGPSQPPMVMDFESLEGIAPKSPAKAAESTANAATNAPAAGKQVAQDPFQQPVQR
jgi:hypothetical protein